MTDAQLTVVLRGYLARLDDAIDYAKSMLPSEDRPIKPGPFEQLQRNVRAIGGEPKWYPALADIDALRDALAGDITLLERVAQERRQ